MKKVTKVLTVLLLVAMIVMTTSNVFAGASGILTEIENSSKQNVNMGSLTSQIGKVIAYLRNAAVIIGVVIIVILGIKYMTGSVEEKAGYQKSFVPLIVGIVVVVSATSIASFLFGMLS